ncbi:zn 2cys6 transcription factor [Diplodia corticola]|uniref:Zn 2cys6 transcription factor n=1 Tax=Diplodia corticola TaxID=236234 RepID=A0A1J9S700_9PEZI|nr:zn 2cys6 transcription factor [Diplodia corticola]OJD35381.1 zn 2cys6 transcription factor [Diplodia corticola]
MQEEKKNKKKTSKKQGNQVFLDTGGRRPIFLNTTYMHMSRDGCFVDDEDVEQEVVPKPATRWPDDSYGPLMGWRLGAETQLSCREAYLLDYFTSFICPNCSLSPTHNPYLRYITPMARCYAPLQQVILSVAANQLRLLNDHRYEREAWLYKARAMSGLRASMDAGAVGWPFVATVLMLCFYDISDGCDESWLTHLKGGLGVLQHMQGAAVSQHTEGAALAKFFTMYFTAHQIMSTTARETDPAMPAHTWLDDDCMDEIDALMGCSRGLLSLIDQTSAAASRYSATRRTRAAASFSSSELTEIRLVHRPPSSSS